MQKTTLAFVAAAFLCGAASAAPATQFKESFDGVGHMLIVPYYTVQSGNATLLNIVNTDKVNGKAVKVRFRGASNADDVFNFTLFLAPSDVWAAEISQNPATGLARLQTADHSCTLPSLVNLDFNTARINPQADKPNETREGYIDIITMADVVPGTAIFTATQHVKGRPPAPCSQGIATYPNPDPTRYCIPPAPCGYLPPVPAARLGLQTEAEIAAAGFGAPTTGLFANWSIFNVAEATSWSGVATAISVVDAEGKAGQGNVVVKPQTVDVPSGAANDLTADPLLRSGAARLVQSDLPDLSTPYIGQITPAQQAAQLSGVLAKTSVQNEYFTDDAVQAQTDLVFTLPTRRYSVAMNHANAAREFTQLPLDYFSPVNSRMEGDNASRKVCLTDTDYRFWDRAEQEYDYERDGFFLGTGHPSWSFVRPRLCGAVFVLSFNAGDEFAPSALAAQVSRKDWDVARSDGWSEVTFPDSGVTGVPVVGAAFSKATSTNIGAGVSGNFGLVWEHRYTRPGDVIP